MRWRGAAEINRFKLTVLGALASSRSDGEVKCAGSIRFWNNYGPSRGKITQWTNNSGHYQPPTTLSGNAGLPQGLFDPR